MKKTEIKFLCDECGYLLPEKHVSTNAKGEVFYDFHGYNTAVLPMNQDADLHIEVDIVVDYDYGPTYRELCPKCRIKWLKKALDKFGEALKDAD